MGLDYIRRATDSFQRKWDRSQERLKAEDLFYQPPDKLRLITLKPVCPEAFFEGGQYELAANNEQIEVWHDQKLVGVCADPPPSIMSRLIEVGAIAEGAFFGQREFDSLIDIAIAL
jgi:hypothetical protein